MTEQDIGTILALVITLVYSSVTTGWWQDSWAFPSTCTTSSRKLPQESSCSTQKEKEDKKRS